MSWRSLVPLSSLTHLPGGRGEEPFGSVQREINRLFDETFRGMPIVSGLMQGGRGSALRLDVKESDKAFVIHAECPGVTEKDIDVTYDDGVLTIKGEKKVERDDKTETWHIVERSYGSFARSLVVPGDIEADKIEARFDKGILTVTLPKSAKAAEKSRKIEVRAG